MLESERWTLKKESLEQADLSEKKEGQKQLDMQEFDDQLFYAAGSRLDYFEFVDMKHKSGRFAGGPRLQDIVDATPCWISSSGYIPMLFFRSE